MLRYCFLFSAACALTQADSLLHPGQEVFGIAAPHLGILHCRLHSILTATEGQVCFLGWEGVHQHHCRLHTLGSVPRDHTVSIGLHPTACLSWRTQTASSLKETPIYYKVTTPWLLDFIRQNKDDQKCHFKKKYTQTQNRKQWLHMEGHSCSSE